MDERQAQIRERAGLEESRLNLEFIEWLRKWGTPLLLVAAVAAGAFAFREKMTQRNRDKKDQAFGEFEAARGAGNASPDALLAVASEYQGVGAVSDMARLEAADAYLDAVRRRVKVGAVLTTDAQGQMTGELANAEDALTEDDRLNYLNKANELYQAVHDGASDAGRLLLRVNAMYGLAAVAESREQYDAARGWYDKIATLTDGTNYGVHAKIARQRGINLGELATIAPIPLRADVPKPPPLPAERTVVPASTAVPIPGFVPPEPAPQTPPGQPQTPPGEPAPAPPPEPAPAGTPK